MDAHMVAIPFSSRRLRLSAATLLTFVALSCATGRVASPAELTIGAELPRALPGRSTSGGLLARGGTLLTAADGRSYGFESFARGDDVFFVLSELIGPDPGGAPHFTIRDVMRAERLRTGESYIHNDCSSAGIDAAGLVAVGRWPGQGRTPDIATGIRAAWRADPDGPRIESVPVETVTCRVDEDRD